MFKIVKNLMIENYGNNLLRANELLTTTVSDKKTLIILNIIAKRKKVTSTTTGSTSTTASFNSASTNSASATRTAARSATSRNINENSNSMTNYKSIHKNITMSKYNNETATNNNISNNKKCIDYTNDNMDFNMQQKILLNSRKWEDTQLGAVYRRQANENADRIDGTQFVCMSYNILAQELLDSHSFLYEYHDQRALVWSHRYDRLIDEIVQLNPQVLCLQEVQESKLGQLCSGLGQFEYGYIYKKRTGYRSDGCAIFYDTNIFDLIEEHSVEYFQPNVEILNRENVAVIAKLSLKSDPNVQVVVATTHLLYNPKRQDVRLAQVQILLAELDRISYDGQCAKGLPKHLPIILTGDFNLQPFTAPYELITNGYVKYDNLEYKTLKIANDRARENGPGLLPPELGITDHCQHVNVAQRKLNCNTKLHHSENNYEPNKISLPKNMPFNQGYLKHKLNLTSVYQHNIGTKYQEASTYQDQWITVDYVFYSKIFNNKYNTLQEGNLKLLSRYLLPSVQHCTQIGSIPNLYVGSDHLSTAASFLLTTPNYSKL